MALTIKHKLVSGIIFQFMLILLVAGFSIYFIMQLKQDSAKIITNNYESLQYCHNIQKELDSMMAGNISAAETFEINLSKQEKNITEPGEKEATQKLRENFNLLKKNKNFDSAITRNIRSSLQQVLILNMDAIKRKNNVAAATAENATSYILIIASVIIIIALSFIFNFASLFTIPIDKLKTAIEAISKKDYTYRVRLDNKDEFGQLANAFNLMAERLDEYEHSNINKLMFEKSRAEAVINSLQDAGFGIDKENKILFVNEQALNILGLKTQDIVGKLSDDVAAKNDLFRFLVKEQTSAPFKIVLDSRESYFIKDTNDIIINEQLAGKVYSIKNITSFREKDVAKTNFLATISHELKTPLASIDIGLKLILNESHGTLSPFQKEIVGDLQKDNRRLLKLVSELLDLSQAETGNINLDIVPVDPNEIINAAENAMKQSAAEKSISVEMQQAGNLPLINADREKAVWVLINLLSNAIKFSPPGQAVYINAEPAEGGLSISVTDKGPGIPEEYQQRIFERFFKVPGSRQLHQGTGLGLSISKEFMLAMGGNISVQSGPGSSTSFNLIFTVSNK